MTEQNPDLLALREGLPPPWNVTWNAEVGLLEVAAYNGAIVGYGATRERAEFLAAIPSMLEEIERLRNALEAETARLNRALDLAQEQGDARVAGAALNAEMRDHIASLSCPRPANGAPDSLTVRQCMERLECGCNSGAILAKTESP